MPLVVHARKNLVPALSYAINPPEKATMLAGEVPHFMCEHGTKLRRCECSQEGKTHDQIVVEPAKHSKLWNLHDRRVKVAGNQHVMNLWAIEFGRDFTDQV